MTDETIPSTKLDAVNLMLMSIGQTPLNTLDTSTIKDAAMAELTLDMQTRAILSRGWNFNTDYDFEIAPDVNDNILVPSNALQITPTEIMTYDLIERDNGGTRMMYDRENNTFTITVTLDYEIVRAFQFATLPEAARGYIMSRAARIFQSQVVGSQILRAYTMEDENEALTTLQLYDNRSRSRNVFARDTGHNVIHHRHRRVPRWP